MCDAWHEDTERYVQVDQRCLISAQTPCAPAGKTNYTPSLHKRCVSKVLTCCMAAGCTIARALGRCAKFRSYSRGCTVLKACHICSLLGFPHFKASVRMCRDLPNHGLHPSAVSAARHFHGSLARGAEISVVVPSMGDSISEGSVASLEKKPGLYCSNEVLPGSYICTGTACL